MTSLVAALLLPPVVSAQAIRTALDVNHAKPWPVAELTGTAVYNGLPANYSFEFESNGRYLCKIESPLGDTFACDGNNYWNADRTGATRGVAFEEKDEQRFIDLILTDAWLDPNPNIRLTPQTQKPGQKDSHLTLQLLDTGLTADVDLDVKTKRPLSVTTQFTGGPYTLKITSWIQAGNRWVPKDYDAIDGGVTDKFRVADSHPAAAPDLQMPAWQPKDVEYDPAQSTKVEAKRLLSGHIAVHPLLNGKDAGWFLLDTGASGMCIDSTTAKNLDLKTFGDTAVVGIGGILHQPFVTLKTFQLGPQTIKGLTFVELDLEPLSNAFGIPIGGIVGYDFFRRSLLSVQPVGAKIDVLDPATYQLPQGASWNPLQFPDGNIAVQASFEGDHTGWFRLDTGADGTVTFHSPIVEKDRLLQGRKTDKIEQAGVGGNSESLTGEISWFQLGGHKFVNPRAVFSQNKVGVFSDRYLAGNIGEDLLSPFDVIFDYANSRIAFLPAQTK